MNRYAVGVSNMEDDIHVLIVKAETEFEAIYLAVLEKYEWDIRNEDGYAEIEELDDLVTFVLQGDILVSYPVLIN